MTLHEILSQFNKPRDGLVFLYLLSLADERGEVHESMYRIAEDLEMPRNSLLKVIDRLEAGTFTMRSRSRSHLNQKGVITICNCEVYGGLKTFTGTFTMRSRHDLKDKETEKEISLIPPTTPITLKEKDKEKESSLFGAHAQAGARTRVFAKPTIDEIQAYITEKGYHVSAAEFFNFYESKNWMIGKNKMSKWKSALYTWEAKYQKDHPSVATTQPSQDSPAMKFIVWLRNNCPNLTRRFGGATLFDYEDLRKKTGGNSSQMAETLLQMEGHIDEIEGYNLITAFESKYQRQ